MAAAKGKTTKKPIETGRRSKLTPKIQQELCTAIASGLDNHQACILASISQSSFYLWLQKGQEDIDAGKKSIHSEFSEAIEKARIHFEMSHLKNITNAAKDGSWQASAWVLERSCREKYGRTRIDASVEISGKDGAPIKTESKVQVYIPDNSRENKE